MKDHGAYPNQQIYQTEVASELKVYSVDHINCFSLLLFSPSSSSFPVLEGSNSHNF